MLGARRRLCLAVVLLVAAAAARRGDGGVTSAYRRKLEATVEMPMDADVFRAPAGYNAPQQVHITLGDQTGTAMTVSWVTENELGNSTVMYGTSPEEMEMRAVGTHTRYDYFNYTSGFIHHCTLKKLKVFFSLGSDWLLTPPAGITELTFSWCGHRRSIAPSTTTPWGSVTR